MVAVATWVANIVDSIEDRLKDFVGIVHLLDEANQRKMNQRVYTWSESLDMAARGRLQHVHVRTYTWLRLGGGGEIGLFKV